MTTPPPLSATFDMKALRDYLQSHGELFFDVLELATCGFYLRPIHSASSPDTQPPLFSQLCFSSLGQNAPPSADAVSTWLQLVHPEDREVFEHCFFAPEEHPGITETPLRYRLRRGDGSYRYSEERGRKITLEESGEAIWLSVLLDVDGHFHAKQELEDSHREIQTILDTIPTFVWIKDDSHRILRVNRAAADATGMSPKEIEGRLTREIYPQQGDRFQASDRQLLEDKQPLRRVPETLENQNGKDYKVLIDKYEMPSLHDQAPRILVVGTNITEIDEAQRALANKEAQFRNLFERSPMGSVLIDSNHQLQLVNSKIESMYQLAPTADRPIQLSDLLPLYLHDQLTPPANRRASQASSPRQLEFQTSRIDGSEMRISVVTVPIEVENQIMTLATFTDITERHLVAIDLKAKQEELERSNEDLDRFAYIASHDLKAPLRGIMHLAEWINEDMPKQVGQEVRKHLTMLNAQVSRMDRLLNDLLAYARVNQQTDTVEPIDLNVALPQLFAFMSPPGTMRLSLPERLPSLTTARGPLEQVFRNLIGNSIKHASQGSVVTVTSEVIDDSYQFTVSDDGPGIPSIAQERIFGMFQTLESGQDRRGTGMGLHLVKRLVQVQGCEAWVESDKGEGATFRFTWPADEKIIPVDEPQLSIT
ncbi:PAS domain-containing sensor histidine kinase [Rhodopirellula sp. P2]|uniref:PAS domain-containing sensor histidine kinase n=1 Tax=Rhodopirellula sp. P2 TaxID=2127060 RepID=UPI002367472C|nr:PAS domain S-box protein [Rhodopirellula sp. P2]WDQ15513.1 PAS domain S-box protein [Rhodopirellula sp. P2]